MNAAIWENSRKLEAIEVMLGLGLAIFLSWVVTNWPEQAGVANVFLILLVFSGVIYAGKPLKTMQSVGFGVSERNALYALFAGAALGVFLTGSGFFIFNPLSALAVGSATLIFVGVVAPLAEETFFRGSLMPTLAELTGNAWLANGIQAGAFGLFHFLVSGGALPL